MIKIEEESTESLLKRIQTSRDESEVRTLARTPTTLVVG